jgi:short subunit dehydrogenase-like uncharacterized protein
MDHAKPFDVIVFGATGFTGRLVAEYLNSRYGRNSGVAWAMAGRSRDKLAAVHREIGAGEAVPLLAADASDAASLDALVRHAKVVLTTVGPYERYGEPLVTACARAGTDYVDLCGEPLWMARMIPALEPQARTSGARIVFSCGFDSVPFDLGVVFLQEAMQDRFGVPAVRVRGRVRRMKGGPSGGTIASLLGTVELIQRDPAQQRVMADPFALTPGFTGPAQPDGDAPAYDDLAQSWTGPFVMAPINTKNVHRTNALRGHPWGREFRYDERMMTGDGRTGEARARRLARSARVQNALLAFAPTRAVLARVALPKPGEGPSRAEREAGRYDVLFIGEAADGRVLRALVKGDRDPGYGSTSKMVSEAAISLAQDIDRGHTGGGVWTPGSAMGLALVRRLQANAGVTFEIVD